MLFLGSGDGGGVDFDALAELLNNLREEMKGKYAPKADFDSFDLKLQNIDGKLTDFDARLRQVEAATKKCQSIINDEPWKLLVDELKDSTDKRFTTIDEEIEALKYKVDSMKEYLNLKVDSEIFETELNQLKTLILQL